MSTLSWKLVPFVALVALGLFALSPGAGVPSASADVEGIDVAASFTSGGTVTVTVNLTEANEDDNIEISVVGATAETLTVVECVPGCANDEEKEDNAVTVVTNGLESIELTLTATCTEIETIEITAEQAASTMTEEVDCIPFEPNVTIIEDANGATVDFDFAMSGLSNECDQSFSLGNDEEQGYACDENGSYTVTQAVETGYTLSEINCTDSGVPDGDIDIDIASRSVSFTIGTNDSIECTFVNVVAGTATPTVTMTPTGATGVTVSAAPSTVNCSGSSFITVVVKSGTANVADGTTVSVTTTSGSLSPTSAPTSGGGILTIFTAGSTSGTATITASAGGQTGTTTVTVNCGAPTAVPTSPPPPPPVQTVAPGGGIRPPNTGDAGLVANGGINWMIVGVVAVIATSAAGGLVLARRRF